MPKYRMVIHDTRMKLYLCHYQRVIKYATKYFRQVLAFDVLSREEKVGFGFGVWGLGLGVWGLGWMIQGLGV